MDKVLITGGAGFIGSHLAQRLLREGKRLAIVDNLDEYYPSSKSQFDRSQHGQLACHLHLRGGPLKTEHSS